MGKRDILNIFRISFWVLFAIMFALLFDDYLKSKVKEQPIENKLLQKSMDFCKLEISKEIAESVNDASKKYNVPVNVIYAIIAAESSEYGMYDMNKNNIMTVNKKAKSCADCIGLMQLSRYAVDEYNEVNGTNYTLLQMYEIPINIEVGTWYYKRYDKYARTWEEAYMIYNIGYGNYLEYKDIYKSGYKPDGSGYKAVKRFEVCLDICRQYFSDF